MFFKIDVIFTKFFSLPQFFSQPSSIQTKSKMKRSITELDSSNSSNDEKKVEERKKSVKTGEFSSALRTPLIADSMVDCIGRTPIVRLGRIAKEHNVVANILLKLESMNPCSSVKDRIARTIVLEAEKRGEITPGETILLDCTSGNTGIGLAMVGAAKGYQVIIVMPEYASLERRVTMKALGAKLVLTPGEDGISGAFAKSEQIAAKLGKQVFYVRQFSNPDNPRAHR
jgi:threonine dehydratase